MIDTNPTDHLTPMALLDAGESGCGELLMLITRQLKTLPPGAVLEVHTYDLAAEIDIAAYCRMTGHSLREQHINSKPKRLLIQKRR
jgi:tRNA 2-thiouridine synthesizing protein A